MLMIKKIYQFFLKLKQRIHNQHQLRGAQIGENNNVFGKISIVESKKLVVGNNCSFNHDAYINAGNGILIGDDVTVSAKASIISTGIDYEAWAKGDKRHTSDGKIIIGKHVWIGANAVILPNVTIDAQYVVIAAGAVVTKDIRESYSIYAGIPAKKINSINYNMEHSRNL